MSGSSATSNGSGSGLFRITLAAAVAVAGLAVCAGGAAAADAPLDWTLVSVQRPRLLWVSETTSVRLRLRNTGTEPWSEERGVHLSYHWLLPDGSVAVNDGLRTSLPGTVSPGQTVEVEARLAPPPRSGRWILQWDMVREHVRWFGAPRGGVGPAGTVVVMRRCGFFLSALLLATLLAVAGLRRRPPPGGSPWWVAVEAVPVLWTAVSVGLITTAFSELVGQPLSPGPASTEAVISGAALCAVFVALLPGRWRWAGAAAVALVLSVTAFADLLYMRYFGGVIPVAALAAARQAGRLGGSIRALTDGADAWLVLPAVAAVVLFLGRPRRSRGDAPGRTVRWTGAAVVLALTAAAGYPAAATLADALGSNSTSRQIFSQKLLVRRWGLVNLHLFDVVRTVRDAVAQEPLDPRQKARAIEYYRGQAALAAKGGPGFGVAKGDNLVLIQVESLQEWIVGARVNGREVTPFLDSLRERGLFFPYVFDETNQGRSSDGEFSALNSQHPLARGAVAFLCASDHFLALPEVLRRQGYTTLSAHPFDRGFWNRGVLHPRYGFQTSLFRRELGSGETIGWGLADGAFFTRMEPTIEALHQPFFTFLITLGLHHPFDQFPARHKVLDVGELKDTPLGNYIHAMHYFDASLKAFVEALGRAGLLHNTVIALYGDHDAGFSVDATLLKLLQIPGWDPSLPVRLDKVPLFVLLPGDALHGTVPAVGGHVDIAPTLLHLLGVPRPPAWVGAALTPGRPFIAALPDGSAVDARRMFVASGPRIPPEGACYTFPAGGPLPLGDCAALEERGRRQLEASRLVVSRDLVPQLTATLAPAAAGAPGSAP